MKRFSAILAVLTLTLAVPAGAQTTGDQIAAVIPVVGSNAGAFGANFRTELQVHNPGSGMMTGRLIFRAQGVAGSFEDPSLEYELGPNETKYYDDVVAAMGASGLGSVDVVPTGGSGLPTVVFRAFDDQEEAGTTGVTVPMVRVEDAAAPGRHIALVGPADLERFRFNIGIRTLGEPVRVRVRVFNADGSEDEPVGEKSYAALYFEQRAAGDFIGRAIEPGQTIDIEVLEGRLIAYGTITDNVTNDGSIQLDASFNAAPVVEGGLLVQLTTERDTSVTRSVVVTDPDDDAMTFVIGTPPANGSVGPITTTSSGFTFSYTPGPGFTGSDAFTIIIEDDQGEQVVLEIRVLVTGGNGAPTASDSSVITDEDTPVTVGLDVSDPDGDALTVELTSLPSNGTLSGSGMTWTYTPGPNFHGTDWFTFRVSDGEAVSNVATLTITVTPVNDAPVATGASLTTSEDAAGDVTVSAADTEGDTLTWSVVTAPSSGSVIGTGPTFTYTPNANFHGTDSFTVRANDGTADSNTVTVPVTVTPVNDAPTATAQAVTTAEDTAAAITLGGSDIDGDTLTFSVASGPANGSLTGTAPNLTYTPGANFHGPDSFTFVANDGTVDSATATVTITVTPVNDAPVADAQSVITLEDTAAGVTLTGSDVDGDALTFSVVNAPANGVLTGTAPNLTYTPAPNFHGADGFTFVANDGATDSVAVSVTIMVTPVNDAPVADAQSVITLEDTAAGVTLTGSDVDGDALTYTVVGAPASGVLTGTAPNLTYTPGTDFNGTDSFTFTTSDGVLTSAVATITIEIAPVNDAAVIDLDADDSLTPVRTYNEDDSPVLLTDTDVTITDVDSAELASLTITLTNLLDAGAELLDANVTVVTPGVTITKSWDATTDPTRGVLTLTGPAALAEFEMVLSTVTYGNSSQTPSVTPREVTFVANDGAIDGPAVSVLVDVIPVNDAPVFTSGTSFHVAENATAVTTVTTTDAESDAVSYSIFGGADAGVFAIDSATGELSFASVPDFEVPGDADSNNVYEVIVRADDGNGGQTDEAILVTVTDLNEAPVFTSTETPSVAENTTAVITVVTTDEEGDTIAYSITGGADAALFSINGSTGALSFVSAPDFEAPADADANNVYLVEVTAADGTNTPAQTISVTVTDVNEAPAFTSTAIAAIDENTTAVLTVTTDDPEGNTITYSITGGADMALFSIDAGSGALSFVSAPDFETPADTDTNNVYEVVVTADDGTNAPTQAIAVTVMDVNEAPMFTSNALLGVAENTTSVVTVVTTDEEGDTITYSITGGADAGLFSIDSSTGALTFNAAPDFEAPADADANNGYLVEVTANDGTNTPAQMISVTVTDVNEAPSFTSSATAAIDENTTAVVTVTTDDPEGNTITYSITGGADAGLFAINTSTGALSFLSTPDFESPADAGANNVYDVVVTASDGTNTPTQAIAVTVNDVNEAPAFTSTATPGVAENTTAVITVTTTDVEGDTITYSITGGADAALFSIDGTSGALSFNNPPNFEAPGDTDADNVYQVIVTADDGTNAPAQNISVSVTNVDEAPAFTSTNTASVPEGTTAVVTVTTTDQEGDTITYSITGGADAALFSIDGSTGALSFNSAPDFEAPADAGANNVYDLVITANDGTNAPTQAVTVTVTDVNEAPTFTSTANPNVPENTTAALTVTTTDVEGDTIAYSITGGADMALFSIDGATGAVSFNAAPNFESPADAGANNVYDLVVTADDGTSQPTQAIAITVTNVNEAPAFTSGATVAVDENTTPVTTVTTSDQEGDTVTYSITGGDDAAEFSIDTNSGVLTFTSAPDFEVPGDNDGNNEYLVEVTATDGTNSPAQPITVTINDANEPPAFTSTATPSVAENGTAVVTVTTTDVENDPITYAIIGGADAALFTIDSSTGALSFLAAPNFETPGDVGANNVYEVVVEAADGTSAPTQAITVTVTNVDEVPAFTSLTSANVAENTSAVLTVVATDPEGATLTYAIAGGVDAALFGIDGVTGALSFLAAPDFEAPADDGANNLYDVVVSATDGTNTPTQAIAVTVTDLDEAPVFSSSDAVDYDENGMAAVITVVAADPEGEATTIAVTGGVDSADFVFDTGTGALTFVVSPDFEAPHDDDTSNTYIIELTASSASGDTVQTLTVTVLNVNEPPVITSGAPADVPENTVGTVHTVTATDSDGTTPAYAIAGGADAGVFTINSTTGALSFLLTPNFEAPVDANSDNVYELTVRATDGVLFDDQAITITVTNVNEAPTAATDSYNYVGNTELRMDGHAGTTDAIANTTSATNILDNDTDPDAPASGFATLNAVAVASGTSAQGGSFRLETDGTMYYVPPAGHTGADSVTYQLTDGTNTVNGTINFSMTGTDLVWYVKNDDATADAVATRDGTSAYPFNTLAAASTASDVNEILYVHSGDGSTTGQNSGVTLKNGQKLWGQGIALTVNGGTTLITAGLQPLIANAAGNGVSVGNGILNTQIRGLNLGGSNSAIDVTTTAAGSASVTISNNTIHSATTEGIEVNAGGSGSVTISISDMIIGGTLGHGIDMARTAGTLTINALSNLSINGTVAGSGVVTSGNVTLGAFSAGTWTIGSAVDRVGQHGVSIGTMTGTLAFTDLDVYSTGAALSLVGSGTGTASVTVPSAVATLNASGGAALELQAISATLPLVAMTSVNSATASSNGIWLSNVNGTITSTSGSALSNAAGDDILISGGTANVTYAGTISDSTGRAVTVTGTTGGTKTFSGNISNSGATATGIALTTNTGATINFTGGMTLSTATNAAFTATGGGTVNVTQNNTSIVNTLTTTTGVPLRVESTSFGSSGLAFRSISSNGAASGIIIDNTGANGSLTISGTGADDSGGSLLSSSGDAIVLINTRNIVLNQMNIVSSAQSHIDASAVNGLTLNSLELDLSTDHGILGNDVTGFVATGCTFDRGGAGNAGSGKHGIFFTNLKGASSVSDSTFTRSNTIQFFVTNTTATVNQPGVSQDVLTLSHNTWNQHTGAFGGDHFSLLANGTSNMKLVVNGTGGENKTGGLLPSGSNEGGNAYNVQATGGGKVDSSITAVDAMNVTSGVNIAASSGGINVFDVFGNKTGNGTGFSSTGIMALNVACINSTCTGKFRDNSITHTAPANVNAINAVQEGSGTMTVSIAQNTVNGSFQHGIKVQSRLGTGTTNATINHNTLTQTNNLGLDVINVEAGGSGGGHSNRICLNMHDNIATIAPGGTNAYRIRVWTGTLMNLQDFTGSGASSTDLQNWITTTKSNSGTPVAAQNSGGTFQAAGGNCGTP